jgi:hypothetical protein
MAPQEYENLTRHLAAIHWKNLQWIAEQDPMRTSLQRALTLDHALQQVNARALLDFCARLAAKYRVDHGRNA